MKQHWTLTQKKNQLVYLQLQQDILYGVNLYKPHVYEKFNCTVQLFFINIGMFCLIKTPHINCDLAKELTEHQRQALLSVEILLIINGNVFSEKQMNEQIIDFQQNKRL